MYRLRWPLPEVDNHSKIHSYLAYFARLRRRKAPFFVTHRVLFSSVFHYHPAVPFLLRRLYRHELLLDEIRLVNPLKTRVRELYSLVYMFATR